MLGPVAAALVAVGAATGVARAQSAAPGPAVEVDEVDGDDMDDMDDDLDDLDDLLFRTALTGDVTSTLYLKGTHAPSLIKPSNKNYSGRDLRYTIEPARDSTYDFTFFAQWCGMIFHIDGLTTFCPENFIIDS